MGYEVRTQARSTYLQDEQPTAEGLRGTSFGEPPAIHHAIHARAPEVAKISNPDTSVLRCDVLALLVAFGGIFEMSAKCERQAGKQYVRLKANMCTLDVPVRSYREQPQCVTMCCHCQCLGNV